ncbi:hypothetical protein GGU10DRAFT_380589 [Lentinula aff. detonsa]|uniref:CCHC-type domain-containing protein n=1 Tax=Lentinula aff. detonsa TaxID=2804958 RepID=A0AA38KKP2_9AGAR|nr:hypothetical protein GGU10DRAFT_380589 [Lentinula aff. detonsa]
MAYLEDSQVPEYRQVEVASWFLKGKAYTFFERMCGESSCDWSLKKFYEKLYDFAFPIDFRMEQRWKLVNLQQRNRRIRDHVGIFKDLCNTAGMLDKRHKVIFLWDSFEPVITRGLLQMGHTSETSRLEDLIDDTEKVELIEGVGKPTSFSFQRRDTGDPRPNSVQMGKNFAGGRFTQAPKQDKGGTPERPVASGSTSKANGLRERHSSSRPRSSNWECQPRKQLSEQQRNEYRTAGKCFECRETGHRSHDCPKNNSLKSDSRRTNGPPGFTTHNMESLQSPPSTYQLRVNF